MLKAKHILPTSLIFTLTAVPGMSQTIFQDTFNTSLTSGVETDVNFELLDGRQSGGTTTSTYTEQTLTAAGAFLNVPASGFTDGVLLLRTNYNASSGRAAGVVMDANFAPSLENQQYNVSFEGLFNRTDGASTDTWMSIYLFGDPPSNINGLGDPPSNINGLAPNAGATDFGVLIRQDGRATIWADGAVVQNFTVPGTTGVTNGTVYSFNMFIDETLPTPQATVSFNNIALGTFDFDFEAGDDGLRGFGMRANQGTAGSGTPGALSDYRYNDLTITVIPEPSTYALAIALAVFSLAAIRRRRLAPN